MLILLVIWGLVCTLGAAVAVSVSLYLVDRKARRNRVWVGNCKYPRTPDGVVWMVGASSTHVAVVSEQGFKVRC